MIHQTNMMCREGDFNGIQFRYILIGFFANGIYQQLLYKKGVF